VVIDACFEDAQVNACERMIAKHGSLLDPAQMAALGKTDPGSFPPRVQTGYRRDLEPPDMSEGFAAIEVRPFVRRPDPARTRRAQLVEIDGVLWRSRSGARSPVSIDDAEIAMGRAKVLRAHAEAGWVVAGIAWRPEIAEGTRTIDEVESTFEALRARLGVALEVLTCPHAGGPPVCWCRKPLPGLGVVLAHRHGVALDRSLHVGHGPADRTFAATLGMEYADHEGFFADRADVPEPA
jgi:histidinol phosphatase-like enzyme